MSNPFTAKQITFEEAVRRLTSSERTEFAEAKQALFMAYTSYMQEFCTDESERTLQGIAEMIRNSGKAGGDGDVMENLPDGCEAVTHYGIFKMFSDSTRKDAKASLLFKIAKSSSDLSISGAVNRELSKNRVTCPELFLSDPDSIMTDEARDNLYRKLFVNECLARMQPCLYEPVGIVLVRDIPARIMESVVREVHETVGKPVILFDDLRCTPEETELIGVAYADSPAGFYDICQNSWTRLHLEKSGFLILSVDSCNVETYKDAVLQDYEEKFTRRAG